nr:immunoglobulin heavy chain junction region [Mus musculus]MBK4197190.1 immunoglobulin heavy chain junction region [Mus musculus]MBK4197191.1 immunoglobulin heavy chain junction region [Mus musculus]MBK4197193.1 immunoglobulin heavy chain junction region [Mus musculus]MBK4197194.1 immunoglobulin heavy chain junction region [Mus musculus]
CASSGAIYYDYGFDYW